MVKWADYLVSEVSYDTKRRIVSAMRHEDNGTNVQKPEVIKRTSIISDLRKGISYCTVFSGLDTWVRGDKIRLHRIGNKHAVRIDNNKVDFDNLGPILEMKPAIEEKPEPKKSEPAPKKSEPAPKKSEPAPKKSEPAPKKSEPAPKKSEPAPKKSTTSKSAQPATTKSTGRKTTAKSERKIKRRKTRTATSGARTKV